MPEMTGAEALRRSLEAEGVDTVFALPGVQIMAAFDALRDSQSIRLVSTRHEQTTAYMADGYARVARRPGVALVVPGPGALNATAAVGTAYAASSPVLLISGQIPSGTLGKGDGQLHEVEEQLDVFKPIVKWNTRVSSVSEIPGAIHEAFKQMTTGRPRPVELEIPPDILAATGEVEIMEAELYPAQQPADDLVARAAEALAGAEKPAIVIGGGVLRAEAGPEVATIAETLDAPIVGTQQAKGSVPAGHPQYVGVHYAQIGVSGELLGESDVILVVGTRFMVPGFKAKDGQTIIKIDVDQRELDKDHGTTIAIEADAKAGISAICDALRGRGVDKTGDSAGDRASEYREKLQAFLDDAAPVQLAWVNAVREATGDDAVLIAGMTNIGYWSHIAYDVREGGEFITSGYFGNLGFGFPTALGAKVAAGDRPVVALCGDGGFMYSPQELATAKQHGINLVAVVFDNGAFGASRWDQEHRYGDREIGTEFFNPDWDTLAAAFSVRSKGVDTPAGLTAALREALALDEPSLIHVSLPIMAPPFQLV
ncbi:MAG: thiamine pyrophosphate-binding protein [Dehalococcoidia bacterium]|jgi:acetolactate synthase-1/2/3 large subunit|nr:thiamine pyrophosphate-binding protein [Dehalococcoidia bacterium]